MKYFKETWQKGSVLLFFACMLPIFLFFVSLAVDFGRTYVHRAYLQNVADAASLAGALSMEHSDNARLVPDCPENAIEGQSADKGIADVAADGSMRRNSDSQTDLAGGGVFSSVHTDLRMTGSAENGAHYYCVEIEDHVPLLLARAFLPDNILPEGLPVWVQAWAMVEHEAAGGGTLFANLNNIGSNQTVKDYATIKEAFKLYGGNARGRVENVYRNEDKSILQGILYSYENGTMFRTETVVANSVKTWKYMFIDYQPEIYVSKNNGELLSDGTYQFPFDTWDLNMDLTEQEWKKVRYINMKGIGIGGGSKQDVINNLKSTYDLTTEEAADMLNIPIENIVSFSESTKSPVRPVNDPKYPNGIADLPETDLQARRSLLEAWETKRIKQGGLATDEGHIAQYTGNEALAQLVARNVHGEISAYDPLLVHIESEDINKKTSTTSGDYFYASSVRKLTIKIDASNMDAKWRPYVIFYYGPENLDGETNAERKSLPVTLELNADFKGILFAPYSPVVIKGNGHSIRGLVIGKSFHREDGTLISNPSGSLYTSTGFHFSTVQFDDFDMLDLPASLKKASNVVLTSEKAKQVR